MEILELEKKMLKPTINTLNLRDESASTNDPIRIRIEWNKVKRATLWFAHRLSDPAPPTREGITVERALYAAATPHRKG